MKVTIELELTEKEADRLLAHDMGTYMTNARNVADMVVDGRSDRSPSEEARAFDCIEETSRLMGVASALWQGARKAVFNQRMRKAKLASLDTRDGNTPKRGIA